MFPESIRIIGRARWMGIILLSEYGRAPED